MAIQVNRRFVRWMWMSMLAVFLLESGCAPWTMADPQPTRGPVISTTVPASGVAASLTASTNCVTVGETVTFTLALTNTTTVPMTLTGTHPIEMVLEGFRGSPILHWSATASYPSSVDPVLHPGEQCRYSWPWVADAMYASSEWESGPGVVVHGMLQIQNNGNTITTNNLQVYVGVNAYSFIGSEVARDSVQCTDMK